MIEVIVSLLTGAAVGAAFSLAGAAVPAPPTIAGVTGIAGIALGYAIMQNVRG